MSQRARDTLARATPQNHSKAKKADAPKYSREERLAERNTSKTANASREQSDYFLPVEFVRLALLLFLVVF
jgi:hypothetical protein